MLLRLGDGIDAACNDRVHQAAARLQAARADWVTDIVPAYACLAVFVDPGHPARASHDVLDLVSGWATPLLDGDLARPIAEAGVLCIPTCYDPVFAPDLAAVAAHAGLDADEVVARHCAASYRVAMIGFAPGFPYLIGLDPALAMARRAEPRVRVAAGSVGIGGAQTGIYPVAGPGGWQLIGRTPLRLFDPARPAPSLLQPGQRVRFEAITLADYRRLATLHGQADD